MTDSESSNGIDRRSFGKFIGLAGAAGLAASMGATPVLAQDQADWKKWVEKFYKKPVKMAVSCAGTTNPYFAPSKGGAEDAGGRSGVVAAVAQRRIGRAARTLHHFATGGQRHHKVATR